MSVKENIQNAVKELNQDEKVFISVFKLERFYKRHKIKIFIIIGVLVIFFGGKLVLSIIHNYKINKAYNAYLILKKDENNSLAINTLKENNINLYELWKYKKAIKSKNIDILKKLSLSQNSIISDISKYHFAILEKKIVESELYKDMSILNNISLLIEDKKFSEVEETLIFLDKKSDLYEIGENIRHSIVKDLKNEK